MFNSEQRDFINSINSLEEWHKVIKELQCFIIGDDEITVFIHNKKVIISNESVRFKNGLPIEVDDFTFTDFEKIYKEFTIYIAKNN